MDEPFSEFVERTEREFKAPGSMYRHWLLECVYERGWSTLKCAREIGAGPQLVLADFEQFSKEIP